jgi:hypothetical protein
MSAASQRPWLRSAPGWSRSQLALPFEPDAPEPPRDRWLTWCNAWWARSGAIRALPATWQGNQPGWMRRFRLGEALKIGGGASQRSRELADGSDSPEKQRLMQRIGGIQKGQGRVIPYTHFSDDLVGRCGFFCWL